MIKWYNIPTFTNNTLFKTFKCTNHQQSNKSLQKVGGNAASNCYINRIHRI